MDGSMLLLYATIAGSIACVGLTWAISSDLSGKRKTERAKQIIFDLLSSGKEVEGRFIRNELKKAHLPLSGPGFYAFMENLGSQFQCIEYLDDLIEVDGQIIKLRKYRMLQ